MRRRAEFFVGALQFPCGRGVPLEAAGTQVPVRRWASSMMGSDIFFGCLGVSSIILALGAARSIPEALRIIERISTYDRRTAAQRAAQPHDGPPWGARR
jgi:hypothetical protein